MKQNFYNVYARNEQGQEYKVNSEPISGKATASEFADLLPSYIMGITVRKVVDLGTDCFGNDIAEMFGINGLIRG